jgi:hypothetical protein
MEDMDWIDLVQDMDRWQTLVNSVMNMRVPLSVGNFLTIFEPVRFLERTLLHRLSIYANFQR